MQIKMTNHLLVVSIYIDGQFGKKQLLHTQMTSDWKTAAQTCYFPL